MRCQGLNLGASACHLCALSRTMATPLDTSRANFYLSGLQKDWGGGGGEMKYFLSNQILFSW